MLPPLADLMPEFQFQTSRSSGPGGQNVNKVESRVEVRFQVAASAVLTDRQKELILEKIGSRLTAEGYLLAVAQDDRSQLRNKEAAVRKIYDTLARALHREAPRKATKPSKAAVRRRLDAKKQLSQKKANRRGGGE